MKNATVPGKAVHGTVRVVSKRKGGVEPLPGEIVLHVDRLNPILGNPHILRDHNDKDERDRVISAYKNDFNKDVSTQGPMFQAVTLIAQRVKAGERIALSCWCAQKNGSRRCHADLLRLKVLELAGIPEEKTDLFE